MGISNRRPPPSAGGEKTGGADLQSVLLSGSIVITVSGLGVGCDKQIECVDLASRPGAAGGGWRWIGSAFALSLPMCDLTMCW